MVNIMWMLRPSYTSLEISSVILEMATKVLPNWVGRTQRMNFEMTSIPTVISAAICDILDVGISIIYS
jgi:hypothetical protein